MEFLKSFAHPKEMMALLHFKLGGFEVINPKCDFARMSPSLRMCYDLLNKTIHSFAPSIQALDDEVRDGVCILYLVLRSLDTVEDDMTIPNDIKVPMLKTFHQNLLDSEWKYMNSKDKNRIVLENFPCISKEYRELPDVYQTMISNTCQKMGEGMTVFLERKIDTMDEWDEYCHYVAGLVFTDLVQLYSALGLLYEIVDEDSKLANKYGLFLQKTNIIQDYLEDWNDKRIFWPRAAWSKYAQDIGDFAQAENKEKAVQCLNELITNAMELVPSTILFMSRLKNQSIFNFVAIPQMFSIATLERCYNNPKVFTGVVKIRKGEIVRMWGATSVEKVKAIIKHYTLQIMRRIPEKDPNAAKMRMLCQNVLDVTISQQEYSTSSIYPALYVSMGLMISAIVYTYWSQVQQWYSDIL